MKIDNDNLIISFSCASENPFPRCDRNHNQYQEVLIMDDSSVNLSRLKGGASILKNHDDDEILGIVKEAWIENKKLYVTAQFRKNDTEAVNTFKDIVEGTVRNVSLGYMVDDVEFRKQGNELYGYTKCTPFEVSVAVGVPADETVGFYRSFSATQEENFMEKEEQIEVIEEVDEQPSDEVSTEEKPSDEVSAEEKPVEATEEEQSSDEVSTEEKPSDDIIAEKDAEIEKLQAEVEKLEHLLDDTTKEEVESTEEEIRSVAKIMDAESMVDSALERKISVQEFINENKNFTIKKEVKKMNKFDICKAFRSLMGAENAEFERSVSADAYRNAGLAVNHNAIVLRQFGADGNAAGIADATEYRGDSFIEALRKKMAVDARFISGITGNIQVPNQTGVSTVAWTNGAVAPTNPKVDMLTLSPRRLGAYVDVDRNLLCNGSLDAINLVVEDLLAQIARKLDETILRGNADPAIIGVGTATGVNTVAFNVANATWKNLVDFEGAVDAYDLNGLKFIMSAADKATLKSIPKAAGTVAGFICEDDYINGYPVAVCGGLSTGEIYFGNFEKYCLVGEWLKGMEITIDDTSLAYQGLIRVTGMAMMDVAIANPNGFVKRIDA